MKQPRWLWRRNQKEALKVRVIDRPVTALRVDEFRADAELVRLAATVLSNSNFQLMMSVLKNDHPGFEVLPAGTNPNDRLLAQGRSEGFTICLATLESLGVKADLPERLVSTFGAAETAETKTG